MSLIAIGFLLGIVTLVRLPELPVWPGWWLLIPAVLLFIALPRGRWFAAFSIGFAVALLHSQGILQQTVPEPLIGEDLLVQARVVGLPQQRGDKLRFRISPIQLIEPATEGRLPERIQLSWYRHAPAMKPGELWQLKVRLKPPHGFANPGGFDYESWLFAQGVRATGYVRSSKDNVKLAEAGPNLHGYRNQIASKLREFLPDSDDRGLLLGLALGVRDDIKPASWQLLTDTGTSHLLAISGLHIGLIAGLAYMLVNFGWRFSSRLCHRMPAQKAAMLFSLGPAFIYALLAGFSVPTQRALIMLLVVAFGVLYNRQFNRAAILSVSLILVLLLDPLAVMSAGFWLSFAAVAVILIISLDASNGKWRELLRMQWWLVLALMPLTLLFFDQASLIAPLANLLAVPFVSMVIMPLMIGSFLLWPLWDKGAGLLFDLTLKGLSYLQQFLELLAGLPLAHIEYVVPSFWPLAAALAGVLLLLTLRGTPGRILAGFWFLPLLLVRPTELPQGAFEVAFLDVGQGLSVVVTTQNHTLVYDTGDQFSSTFGAAEAVVLPYLNQLGRKSINTLILSHSDRDHAGGARVLEKQAKPTRILSSYPLDWETEASARCLAGDQWEWDGVSFKVLHPYDGFEGVENDQSCVLAIESSGNQVLLTGDIGVRAELELVRSSASLLPSQVMLVPHHSSLTSSSPFFLQVVSPEYAITSLGYRNRFGFPKSRITQRYAQAEIEVLRTDEQGAVIFNYSPNTGWHHKSHREEERRYWYKP